MITRTWDYGTRLNGVVTAYTPGTERQPTFTIVKVGEEGFIMYNVKHEIPVRVGLTCTIEFTKGGPTGGYWRIVE